VSDCVSGHSFCNGDEVTVHSFESKYPHDKADTTSKPEFSAYVVDIGLQFTNRLYYAIIKLYFMIIGIVSMNNL